MNQRQRTTKSYAGTGAAGLQLFSVGRPGWRGTPSRAWERSGGCCNRLLCWRLPTVPWAH